MRSHRSSGVPAKVIANERPTAKGGEYDLLDPSTLNPWQRVAKATKGFVAPANPISIYGGYLSNKALSELDKGPGERSCVKALGLFALGRVFDVLDGYVARMTKTRNTTGAAIDAGIDKQLALRAARVMTRQDIISERFATKVVANQIEIFDLNRQIKDAGGKPTPSEAGKLAMAKLGVATGARIIETGLRDNEHTAMARIIGGFAAFAENRTLKTMEQATHIYRTDLYELTNVWPDVVSDQAGYRDVATLFVNAHSDQEAYALAA